MTRYLLIGTGVAALAALEALRSVDASGEIFVVGDDPDGYYSRPGLAYYLSGEIEESTLFPYQKADFERLRAHFYSARVQRILPAAHEVELANGKRLPYDKLLIATGAQSIPLPVPGADLQGVHKLDTLTDARALLARAHRGHPAVVTGGGITALELVEGLAARGLKVHYVFRSERYWPSVLDHTESQIVQNLLHRKGVFLYPKTEVTEILGKNGRVSGVRLSDGRLLPTELVAYAIGIAPRIELALAAGLACQRGILVNEYLETSQPDIYAAGDVAQVFDPLAGKHILDSLWTPAREQGYVAGLNMAGMHTPYTKGIPFNVTRLAGLTVTLIGMVAPPRVSTDRAAFASTTPSPQPAPEGEDDLLAIARGDSETWRELPNSILAQSGFEFNRLRLMIGKTQLLGAVVMGDQTLSAPLQKLIREQVDITPIRSRLIARNAPLAEILAEFISQSGVMKR